MSAPMSPLRRMPWPILLAASLAITGCKGSGGGSTIEFTPAAMKSLPSVAPTAGALTAARSGAQTVGSYFLVSQLFQMQCRHPDGGVDYCPPGTPAPPASVFDPYQFTMQTLIGFIFHAQMYTQLVTDCSGSSYSPKTVTAASYSAASSTPGANPTRFILDELSSYTCQATNVSNGSVETRMISSVADGSYQATLHTRYRYDAGNGPQTDFFQVDVAMNAGVPEFLALNFASGAPWRSRIVLLTNLVTHRFVLKYYVPEQPSGTMTAPQHYTVAAGVGGFDLATGTPNPGHYFVDFLDEPMYGPMQRCVDNVGGVLQPDVSSCTADGVPMGWTSSDTIAAYLAVPAAHAARLAPFLAEFATAAALGPADAWQSAGDEDLYWPASLH